MERRNITERLAQWQKDRAWKHRWDFPYAGDISVFDSAVVGFNTPQAKLRREIDRVLDKRKQK